MNHEGMMRQLSGEIPADEALGNVQFSLLEMFFDIIF